MLKLLLTFSFLFITLVVCAQTTHQLVKDTSGSNNHFFVTKNWVYIIQIPNQRAIWVSNMLGINPNNIRNYSVYKDSSHTKQYGERGKNGVAVFTLKKEVKFLTLTQLFNRYHIKNSDRTLPLFVDSALFFDPTHLYLSEKQIKFMRVEIEDRTGMKFINLRTIFPITWGRTLQ